MIGSQYIRGAPVKTKEAFGHVSSVLPVLTGYEISGLTFGRSNLFYVDDTEATIFEVHKDTLALINSFATLSSNPAGLTYKDASSLWYGDRVSHEVYEVNPTTGVQVQSWNVGYDVSALCWDGSNLWIGCEDNENIEKRTTAGVLVTTITMPHGTYAMGLTFVDPWLYAMGIYVEGVLVELKPDKTPGRVHNFKRGYNSYHGLAYDGNYLRLGSGSDATRKSIIYKIVKG